MPISLAKPKPHPHTADRLTETAQGFQRIADQLRAAAPQIQHDLAAIGASLQGVRKSGSR